MLKNFTVFALSSLLVSCSTFAMGKKCPCEDIIVPNRPDQELCIANGVGGAGCFDARIPESKYNRDSITNYVCTNPVDAAGQEMWIQDVLNLIK